MKNSTHIVVTVFEIQAPTKGRPVIKRKGTVFSVALKGGKKLSKVLVKDIKWLTKFHKGY